MVKRHQKQTASRRRHHLQGDDDPHSNIALADPKDGKPTRVGFKTIGKGDDRKLVRVAKRSGVEIDG